MRDITVQPTSPSPTYRRWFYVLRFTFCVLLFVAAAAFRLTHVNWDQFQHVHPDERFIVWVVDSVSLPANLTEALDPARSTINPFRWPPGAGDLAGKPRSYAYGHFPLYLLVAVAHVAQRIALWFGETTLAFPAALMPVYTVGRHLTEYNYLALVGRVISVLSDLGTMALVYWLAQRAYGSRGAGERRSRGAAGLLAAGAYAFAVLPIQLSHFYAVDMVLTFCVVATVALAAKWAEGPVASGFTHHASRITSHLTWLTAGAMAGLAVGSKFSAVLVGLSLLAAAFYRLPEGGRRRKAGAVIGRLAAVGGVAAVVFAVTNPFALIEARAYLTNIFSQQAMVSGLMDAPYTRQYAGTLPYLYFIQQLGQWGLGWPLGLIVWGGLVWAVIRAARRRAGPMEVVMLAWALPYFATTGAFHAKFLRYMAPLLPFLLVFGAGALAVGYRWLVARFGRRGQIAWGAAVTAVAVFTIGWAIAFTGVYRQEHPWIQASRWIYENVPANSKLLSEHWDDALPLTLDEISDRPAKREYTRVELPLYDPDTPVKLDTLVAELSSADYLVIASNRLYVPIQRLPQRYPMSSQYYRLLFGGDLGYTPVAEFTAYPQLGPLTIRDDRADESFTVYDHPRTLIFANTGRLSESLLRARLGRFLPVSGIRDHEAGVKSQVSGGRVPGHARYLPQAPAPGAPLTLSQPVDTLPVVNDFRWNRFASEWAPPAVILWYLVLGIFGWAAWPLLFPLFRGLRDRGYGLARAAGWLLVGWVHWIGVSLGGWQNRVGPLAAILAGLVVLGAIAWRIQRRQIAAFWRERRRLLLGMEALFALAFLAFVGIRLLNPDLWQPWNGGEKFMEFAFLNAILRSPHFPPYDPYFAGGIINYYYYGLYLVSLPIKLTGIAPEVAFNLAIPGLFALTAVGIFSVGYSLVGRRELEGTRGNSEERGGTQGNSGERGGTQGNSGELGGTQGNGGEIGGNQGNSGELGGTQGNSGELGGNQGNSGELGGTQGNSEELGGTQGNSGERGGNQGNSEELGGTQGNSEELGGTQGNSEERGGTQGNSEELGDTESPYHPVTLSPCHRVTLSPPRPIAGATLAVVLALLTGNQAGLGELLRGLVSLGGGALSYNEPVIVYVDAIARGLGRLLAGATLPGYDYWQPSRVIPYTINEFPLWTFLFADLHPHLIAMPFGMLVVGIALNWILEAGSWKLEAGSSRLVSLSPCFLVSLSTFLLVILALGSLGATNTWDLPTYFLIVAGALLIVGWRSRRPLALIGGVAAAGAILALAVAAYWPFYAHYQAQVGGRIGPVVARFLDWVHAASPTWPWLVVWGLFLFLAVSFVVVEWRRRKPGNWGELGGDEGTEGIEGTGEGVAFAEELASWEFEDELEGDSSLANVDRDASLENAEAAELLGDDTTALMPEDSLAEENTETPAPLPPRSPAPPLPSRLRLIGLLLLIGAAMLLAALERPTAALVFLPLALAVYYAFRRWLEAEDAFLSWLVAVGLAIVGGTELIYLRDFLEGGDWYRMNTLFKFSVPAWLLLGLAGGVMLPRLWAASGRAPGWLRGTWRGALILLLAGGLAFLPLGIPARARDRFPGPRPAIGTLDGTAFMTVGRYTWPDAEHTVELAYDYLAIHWLLDNVAGSPVIAEAPAGGYTLAGQQVGYDYYRAGGLRVASLTGFPTFVGQHQSEQRPGDQVGRRGDLGQEFFRTSDIARTRELMAELRVGYVYIGTLERTLFSAESLRKFDALADSGDLKVVYRNAQVTIYQVMTGE
ncbi:MAG: DUF2298 domain-containing protein [Chloroflexi bacterium]|nr:DUF2298 domain-containing protein [Chloroflexota bacterium]